MGQTCNRLLTPHFLGVVIFITLNYLIFVIEYLILRDPSCKIVLLIVFHILLGMLLWSMVKSIISDPGRVPIYWGFFAEES